MSERFVKVNNIKPEFPILNHQKTMSFSKKNQVCIVSPLGYTGLAYYDHSLCQSLSKIGIDITLVTSKQWIIRNQDISYRVEKLFINTYGNRSRLKKGLNYLLSLLKIYFFVIKNKCKIVHFQILEFPIIDIVIFLFLRIYRVKIVYTPHDIYSFKMKSNNNLVKVMYKFCNCIIVHNKANKDLLINEAFIPDNKIRVVAHGNYNHFLSSELHRDDAREKIGLPMNKKLILFFGNIRPGKGLETLISAIKLINIKEKILLIIAGKVARNYDLSIIKTEIITGILKNKVILRDYFIEDDLIEYYYKSANVVVVPYERIYESGVLRYAFSCGMPTIVSNLKEFSEFAVNGENCLIFKAGDPIDLSDRLMEVLQNEDIAKKIAYNAKKLSDNEWDWRNFASKTKSIYEILQ
jgi:D-inositol-3-phosphate glycosyltransferase